MPTVDKSKLRVDIILGVADAIEREPDLYDQDCSPFRLPCNSPCCIAGWAIYVDLGRVGYEKWRKSVDQKHSIIMMAHAFGLTCDEARTLFSVFRWPFERQISFLRKTSNKARASVAASYLRSIVETGEV